jgi:UPF0716 protein FxsA
MAVALFIAFIVVPLLEIYVVVRVAEVIHVWPTVILLLAESALGAWLVKREGRRAWRALREALDTGRLPSRQLADAALVLVGGTLLLTPGFLTDIAGFAFVLPTTRPIARRILAWLLMSRLFAGTRIGRAVAAARATRTPAPKPAPAPASARVVPGEVVEDEAAPS